MPRYPRIHAPQLLYHIIVRGNNRQKIFSDKEDYRKLLAILRKAKREYMFKMYGYVMMPNHFHLLIEVDRTPLSKIMQSMLTRYVKYYNFRHKKVGHLFQGRYKAIICEKENYFEELIRYIHLNPVRAKLVKNADEWEWSGHQEYTGQEERNLIDFKLLRDIFGKGEQGYKKYMGFLGDRSGEKNKDYYPKNTSPFLGTDNFISKVSVKKEREEKKRVKEIKDIAQEISNEIGIDVIAIKAKTKSQTIVKARIEFIRKAVFEYGHKHVKVAEYLNCDEGYISRVVKRKSS